MSSLWTPEGEHRVTRSEEAESAPAAAEAPARPARRDPADDDTTAETEAQIAELERQLAAAPARDVIANHCYGIFQLAALHLGQDPPRLEEAQLAIDAFSALVEGLGDRLGPGAPMLRDGLAQIRLAFVQIAAGGDAPQTGAGG